MNNIPRSIIFDFDYTLADSSVPVVECVNFSLRCLGLREAEPQAIRRTIGLDLHDTLRALVGDGPMVLANEFSDLFVERADEVMVDETVIFDSVYDVVRELGPTVGLGIVSSKYRSRIEAVLRREGLLDSFRCIVGGEDVNAQKPDPVGLRRAVDALGSPLSSSLYVGDSVTDAETARRAGVAFVAVLSGVTPASEFAGYTVVSILNDVKGLPALVAEWSRE